MAISAITLLFRFNHSSTLSVAGTFTNSLSSSVTVGPAGVLTAGNYSQLDDGSNTTDVSGTLITNSFQQGAGTTTVENGGLIRAGSCRLRAALSTLVDQGFSSKRRNFQRRFDQHQQQQSCGWWVCDRTRWRAGTLELQNGSTGTITGGVTAMTAADKLSSRTQLECCGNFRHGKHNRQSRHVEDPRRCPATGWGTTDFTSGEFAVVTGSLAALASTPSSIVVA